jgi:hypothetical protein
VTSPAPALATSLANATSRVTITGKPAAIASTTTIPKFSWYEYVRFG